MNTNLSSFLISIVVFGSLLGVCHGGELRKHFYKDICPLAEDIVKEIIWKCVASNSTLPAKFLRMHLHDCFVRVIHIFFFLSFAMHYIPPYHSCPKIAIFKNIIFFTTVDIACCDWRIIKYC